MPAFPGRLTRGQGTLLRAELARALRKLMRSRKTPQRAARPVKLDQSAVGRLSRMDAIKTRALTRGLREREQVKAAQLTQALQRLETGVYGTCTGCGEAIASTARPRRQVPRSALRQHPVRLRWGGESLRPAWTTGHSPAAWPAKQWLDRPKSDRAVLGYVVHHPAAQRTAAPLPEVAEPDLEHPQPVLGRYGGAHGVPPGEDAPCAPSHVGRR
jgi:DnaK suppressor protein